MSILIKALAILIKYGDIPYPCHCEHDVLYIMVDPSKVSNEDKEELSRLSFSANDALGCFYSYKFGSA